MHIRCENCGADYELDLPRSALGQSKRKLKFRCSACGHSFIVRSEAAAPVDDVVRPASGAPSAAGGTRGMLLKQEGKVYHVSDVATLQRWIVERRVLTDDLVAAADGTWERVGSRPDMAPFFQVVEQADLTAHPREPMMQVGGEDLPPGLAGDRPIEPARGAQPALLPPQDEARRALLARAGLASPDAETWPPAQGAVPAEQPVSSLALSPAQYPSLGDPADDPTVRVDPPALRGDLGLDDAQDRLAAPDEPTDDVTVPVTPVPASSSVMDLSPLRDREHIDDGYGDLDDWRPRRRWMPMLLVGAALAVLLGGGGWLGWSWYTQGKLAFLAGPAASSDDAAVGDAGLEHPEEADASATMAEDPSSSAPDAQSAEPGTAQAGDAAGTDASTESGSQPANDAANDASSADPSSADPSSADPSSADPSSVDPTVAASTEPASAPQPTPAKKPKPKASARSYTARGWSAMDSGNTDLALSYFGKALDRDPSNAAANYGLGYVYDKMGRRETAVHYYCKARNFAGRDVELEREVSGRLRNMGQSCP